MPLDLLLFDELLKGITLDIISTRTLRQVNQYSTGLLNDAQRMVVNVVEHAPSQARIIEIVDRFAKTAQCIIEEKGVYLDVWDARKNYCRVTQKAISGEPMFMTAVGNLTEQSINPYKPDFVLFLRQGVISDINTFLVNTVDRILYVSEPKKKVRFPMFLIHDPLLVLILTPC